MLETTPATVGARDTHRRTYTIGELARRYEVTPRTIRFYEQEGLLEPERRGQTRIYHDKDRVRLKLTLRGKRLGFSLAEIREVIHLYDHAPDGDERQLRRMLDILDEKHSFELPKKMLDAEFQGIWQQVEQDKAAGQLSEEDAGKSEDELKGEYMKIAERRVRLGLVLAEIGTKNNVQVSEQEVAQAIAREARNFPGQERQVFEFYRQNPAAAAQIRAPIYEEKVVDHIFAIAKVSEEPISKEDLLADEED